MNANEDYTSSIVEFLHFYYVILKGYMYINITFKGGWTVEQHDCPPGTDFNPAINNCDWSDNVPDNVCDGVTHKPPTGIALVGLTIISIVLNKQSK